MIIRELAIESFGALHGVTLHGLESGVHVVFGQNEAGKTTLLEFIRGILFGFQKRERYLRGADDALAGRLDGELRGKPVAIRRRFSASAGESCEVLWDRQSLSESEFRELLSGFDDDAFCSIFAITLDELARLRTLDDAHVAEQFYDLSLGVDRAVLQRLFVELERCRTAMLDTVTRSGEIPRLLEERQRLRQEMEDDRRITEEFTRLRRLREELLSAKSEEEAAINDLERQLEALRALDSLTPQRERIAELQSLIPADTPSPISLQKGLTKAERQRKALTHLRRRHQALSAERRELQSALRAVRLSPGAMAIAPVIEGIRLSLPAVRQWVQEAENWRREIEESIARRRTIEAELRGKSSAEEGSHANITSAEPPEASTDDTNPWGESLVRHGNGLWRHLRRLRVRYGKAKRRLHDAEQESEQTATAWRAQAGGVEVEQAEIELQRIGDRLSKLRRLDQVRGRVHAVEEQQHLARSELLRSVPGELTLRQNVTWGVVFVVGLSLALASGLGALGVSAFARLLWIWGVLGGLSAAAVPVVRKHLLADAEQARLDAARRLETMERELESLKREQTRLESELIPLAEPLGEELVTTERRLHELQDLQRLLSQWRAAQHALQVCQKDYTAARQQLRRAMRDWRALLAKAGLAPTLSVRRWPLWKRRLKDRAALVEREAKAAEHLESVTERISAAELRLAELAQEIGLSLPDGTPEEKYRCLANAVQAALEQGKQHRNLRGELRRNGDRIAKCRARIAKRRRELRRLYQQFGVANFSELQASLQEEKRQSSLREELSRLRTLWQSAVDGIQDAKLRAFASLPVAELQQTIAAVQAELEGRWKRLEELAGRLGRVASQIEGLLAHSSTHLHGLELAGVKTQLGRAVRDWWRLSLGNRVLERLRSSYQRDRQPAILKEASEYWQRMTGGRFCRVWTPLEDRVLLAEDRAGQSYRLEQLSRGTREQLFLCLRLALAAHFGRRAEPIPLVLDDVLVNFDQVRAEWACETLHDYAGDGRQVLLFTCHEHIAQLFAAAEVVVRQLGAKAGPETTEEPPGTGDSLAWQSAISNENRENHANERIRSAKKRQNRRGAAVPPRSQMKAVAGDAVVDEHASQDDSSSRSVHEEDGRAEAWFDMPDPYPMDDAAMVGEERPGRESLRNSSRRRNRAA